MLKWMFSLVCLNAFAYQAVLTDIEGTTSSISFVHEVLFPYAKQQVQAYLEANLNDPAVSQIVNDVKGIAGTPDADLNQVIATLRLWMDQDKKITPLKALQGMMWKEGYEKGDFQGHVYEDAYRQLTQWKADDLQLYVYSSGSVQAQKLIFAHTAFGDLTPLFSGYFDTKVGGKKESSSYQTIAKQIGFAPQDVLFLSDSLDELNAAAAAGMATILLCREGTTATADCPHSYVTSFNEIQPR